MFKWNKSIFLLLLASMLLGTACGGGSPQDSTAAADDDTTTTAPQSYQLPTGNFGGKEFNIMLWERSLLPVEEETGDVVDDAIYARARTIEEKYNIKMTYRVEPQGAGGSTTFAIWLNTLNTSILADDDSIQLAGGYTYQMASNTLNGGFANVLELPHLSLDEAWWPKNLLEAGNLGGAMYLLTGNIDPGYYGCAATIFFNKKLADEYKLGNLYDLVKSGGWTFDKLMELSSGVSGDLNGDAAMTKDDQWGLSLNWNFGTDAFLQCCDIPITKMSGAGTPELLGLTDKYVTLYDSLKTLLYDSGNAFHGKEADTTLIFTDGRALFSGFTMKSALSFRDENIDFGIIPYPKWDKAQESYITYSAIGNATGFIVPATTDPELAGCVLEAMAYLGYQDVLPEYYEKALKGKGTRDDESAEMLDIIYDNISFEFTQIYSSAFGDQQAPSMMLRMSFKNNQELASMWASRETLFDETMKKLIDTLK